MKQLVSENIEINRSVVSRDEAVKFFKNLGEVYKAEIIESIPSNEDLSLYTQGGLRIYVVDHMFQQQVS